MLLFPFILSHPALFLSQLLKNPFSVPKSWGLASAVSSPVGPGSTFYCALLCCDWVC